MEFPLKKKKHIYAWGQPFVDSSQHWAPLHWRKGVWAEEAHINSSRKLLMSKDDELACLTLKHGPSARIREFRGGR